MKVVEVIEKTKGDILERTKEIEQMEKEKIRLQRIVEKQEISASDVEKMNVQKEKLERRLVSLFLSFFFLLLSMTRGSQCFSPPHVASAAPLSKRFP